MKVKELIAELETLDPNLDVILQKDSEGNGYSPCAGVDGDAVYRALNTWCGVVYDTTWSAEDADMSEQEWEQFKEQPRVAVLYPIN
jgi:hypothetical protein